MKVMWNYYDLYQQYNAAKKDLGDVKLATQATPVVLAQKVGVRVAEDGRVCHQDDGADAGENKAWHHRPLLLLRRDDGDGTRNDEDDRDGDTCEDWQPGVQVSQDVRGQVHLDSVTLSLFVLYCYTITSDLANGESYTKPNNKSDYEIWLVEVYQSN